MVDTINKPQTFPMTWSLADLQRHLSDIPADRIRLQPAPGSTTQDDVIEIRERKDHYICELIDGVAVMKIKGLWLNHMAMHLASRLMNHTEKERRGYVLGGGVLYLIPEGQVRIPDVSYIAADRFPPGKLPSEWIPGLAPNLAIEFLGRLNTDAEMDRKVKDYLSAGALAFWIIDPRNRTAAIYTSPDQFETIDESGVLRGGEVLPGFELPLSELFARAEEQGGAGE